MQALLFANRPGTALLPLTEHTCAAMLPVVGKPLVVFAIEDLVSAGIREALVVVSTHAELVEQELGNGARWGMRLEYVIARPDETPERIVTKIVGQLGEQFLMIRGDLLRTPLLKQFFALVGGSLLATEAVYGGKSAALRLCRQSVPETWRLGGDPEQQGLETAMMARIDFPDARVSSIESLTDYHRANLDAAAGRYAGLIVPGREVAPGVRSGRQSRLPASAIKGSSIFVGSRCRIDRSAELMNDVVVSDDVIVDRNSTLSSAVILPHTYIGELVDVSDSIVSSNYLISVPSNSVTRVVDSFLLSGLKPITYTRGIGSTMHRVLGLVTLMLSIPLWPLMLIASLMADMHRPFRRLILVGNKIERTGGLERRRSFVAFEAATSIPPFKWMPLLLAVVSGNLRMIGGEAISPEREAALELAWERLREEAPIGLVGPVCLAVGRDAPEEERRVVEGYYARTRSGWGDLQLLGTAIRALFKPSSWIPAPRGIAPAREELSAT